MKLSLKPVADSAILVEFENEISEAVSDRVLALLAALDAAEIEGLIEAVPSYRTLLVYYDPLKIETETLSGELTRLAETGSPTRRKPKRWQVPVWYGGPAGVDLDAVAARHGLSRDEVIEIHSGTVYRVYLVGFAPGWTFLGGLDERLHTPRLDSPRAEVPAGSISIAGQQGLICGPAMPSGWNLIGQTPERTWAPEREEPFFIEPGDEVEIRRIDEKEFKALRKRVEAGERVAMHDRGEGTRSGHLQALLSKRMKAVPAIEACAAPTSALRHRVESIAARRRSHKQFARFRYGCGSGASPRQRTSK